MPLFECEKCHCVENTALSHYWSRYSKDKTLPALCSECDPRIGKWHGRFSKEPAIALDSMDKLCELADLKLLIEFHAPVQHTEAEVLEQMHRNVKATLMFIEKAQKLKDKGVFLATNIITNYKNFPDPNPEKLKVFDYISWNPYWDGKWDRKVAEARYHRLIEEQ